MANVYDLLKQGTAGTPGLNNTELLPAEENNEVSTIASIFAGIGSGLIDKPIVTGKPAVPCLSKS